VDISSYQGAKLWIVNLLGLSKDAIHIYVGMSAFLVSAILFRRTLNNKRLLIPVFFIALWMEILDMRDDLRSLGYFRWSASLHDLVNTCFWPIMITLFQNILKRKVEPCNAPNHEPTAREK
jgi:hypothetical protein